MCSNLRRASRALTQLYESRLRPVGLRATQFTILQLLSITGELNQGQLGEMLAMDSTSLTRTLAIMRRQDWIAERNGKDRRERWIRLARPGEAQLKRAVPAWDKVQSQLRRQLGVRGWNALVQSLHQVTTLATNKGDSTS
jgi:DNA-binding MarR family transcriptional regulator